MSLPNVNFKIQNGGLARAGLNEDVTSGLLMFSDTMPSGWTSGDVVELKSLAEAELVYNITSTNDSKYEWFQISEYFKANPSGILWTSICNSGATYDFAEIATIQRTSGGKVRRLGIQMFSEVLDTADIDLINTQITTLYNDEMPLVVVYAPNTFSTDFTALPDLRAGDNSDFVSVLVAQDASGTGYDLAVLRNASITPLGKFLGLSSANEPNINLGWVGEFDWKDGNENDQLLIGTSDFNNIISSQLDTLNDKGYCFLYKKVGLAGSFLNDMPTCSTLTNNSFAYLPEGMVMYKAVRDVRTKLANYINQSVPLNEDGTMAITFVRAMENDGGAPLLTMKNNGIISNYKIYVNPDQDVVSTSQIDVVIGIQGTATSRMIEVSIGFVATI